MKRSGDLTTYSDIQLHHFFFSLRVTILLIEITPLLCFFRDLIFSLSFFCWFIWTIRRWLYMYLWLFYFNIVFIGIQNYYSISFLFWKKRRQQNLIIGTISIKKKFLKFCKLFNIFTYPLKYSCIKKLVLFFQEKVI